MSDLKIKIITTDHKTTVTDLLAFSLMKKSNLIVVYLNNIKIKFLTPEYLNKLSCIEILSVKIENKKVDLCDEIIKDLKLKNTTELTSDLKIQLLSYISKINNLSNNTINVINRNMNYYQEFSHTGFETMVA